MKFQLGNIFFWCCHSLHQICWDFDGCLYMLALFAVFLQLFYVSCGGWCFSNDCWSSLTILRICNFYKPWPANWINNENICPWWQCDSILILFASKIGCLVIAFIKFILCNQNKTHTQLNHCIFVYIQSNYFWIN